MATNNVFAGERIVREKRDIALAAGASLECLEDALNGADYITEVGHGVDFSKDGRVDSEASAVVRNDKAHFQLRVEGILEWQAHLDEAGDDAEIPASPTSSALSDASEYYKFRDWDVMDHMYDRQLVPWDSASYRQYRSGIKSRITSHRCRQEAERSAIGPERYGDDDGGTARRYDYRDFDDSRHGDGYRARGWHLDRSPVESEEDWLDGRQSQENRFSDEPEDRASEERDVDENLSDESRSEE
jgi:hypothetical protein